MHQRSSSSSLFCVFRSFYAPNPEEWEWQNELALLNSDRMREKSEDKIKLILTTLPPVIFILWLSFNLSVIHFQFAYISPYQHCGQFCYCNWWSVVSFFQHRTRDLIEADLLLMPPFRLAMALPMIYTIRCR